MGAVGAITGGGADVAIDRVGRTATMHDAFMMVRPGGRAVVIGLPELGDRLEIEPVLLLFEKSIKGLMYGSAESLPIRCSL